MSLSPFPIYFAAGGRRSLVSDIGFRLLAGLIAELILLICTSSAGAIECTDFPSGLQVNQADLGDETDVDIFYDSDGVLHAAWLSGPAPAASADVYYARSTDGGLSFGPSVKVNWSDHTATRYAPRLKVDLGGTIYVTWTDDRGGFPDLDIYFSKSSDGGLSFTQEVRVNDWNQGDQSFHAIEVTPGGTVYVGWISHAPVYQPSVRITRSVGGLPFEASRQVNGGTIVTSCECCNIDIASIGEQKVFVAFMANLDYVRDIFVSRSNDGGWVFEDPVQVNDGHWFVPACPSSGPRLLAGPEEQLNVTWLDGHDNSQTTGVYYARSTDDGKSFLYRTRINRLVESAFGHPRVAVTPDGTVHVAWDQYNDAMSAINLDYARSTDGGKTFSLPCPVGGGSPNFQWLPSLAASPNGALSLAWNDDRNGRHDIFVATAGSSVGVGSGQGGPLVVWRAAPNPFRGWVGIEPASGWGSVALPLAGFSVVDVRGRHVREVSPSGFPLGWDGRDDLGRPVPAGSYFLRIPGGQSLRLIRLR